jgi:agmatinase
MPRYGPPDAFVTPRFSGPRTFMRLPHVTDLDGVDVAVIGVPTDGAQVFRSGSRFGPEAIRSASVMLRNYNPILAVDVCERLSLVDYGDVATVPGSTTDSLERSSKGLEKVAGAGVVTLCLGGDHSVLLAELRALAAVHGPLALVQLDAHHDLWDEYFGQKLFHGSVVRRAAEEGLVDPARSVQAGIRGSLTSRDDATLPAKLGFDALTYEELAALGPASFGDRVRTSGRCAVLRILRYRLRRPRIRSGHGYTRGGRPLQQGGAGLRPRAHWPRLPRLRLRRGLASVRSFRRHRIRRRECVLRDALASGATTLTEASGHPRPKTPHFPGFAGNWARRIVLP